MSREIGGMMETETGELERLLADRFGLDPHSVGSRLIQSAARQRMKELGLDDLKSYLCLARQSESELQLLVEEVVVSESWFFRDARPYGWFRDYVRKNWVDTPLRQPLRILSLACASGEEPYSIAIALHELELPPRRFQINAVDISARRLAIARLGVYSSNAFRASDLSFRARYFREHPQGFELDPSIRSAVVFQQASVLTPGLLEGSGPYDIVFCRNLLIYLESWARKQVLALIERLLTSGGLLFIGHADRLDIPGVESRYIAIEDPACFVYRLRTQGDSCGFPHLHQLNPPPSMAALTASSFVPLSHPITSSFADGTIASGSDPLDVGASPASPATEPSLLEQAAELANKGRFSEAINTCERQLRLKGFSPAVYYLMGMVYQAAGDRARAEQCFHKTVYLDPVHDEALLALALLAERRGDQDAAVSFRRRAERSVTASTKRVY